MSSGMMSRSLLLMVLLSVGGLAQAQLQCRHLVERISALSQSETVVTARLDAPKLENGKAFKKYTVTQLKKLQFRRFLVEFSEFTAAFPHFKIAASGILIERDGVKFLQIEIRDAVGNIEKKGYEALVSFPEAKTDLLYKKYDGAFYGDLAKVRLQLVSKREELTVSFPATEFKLREELGSNSHLFEILSRDGNSVAELRFRFTDPQQKNLYIGRADTDPAFQSNRFFDRLFSHLLLKFPQIETIHSELVQSNANNVYAALISSLKDHPLYIAHRKSYESEKDNFNACCSRINPEEYDALLQKEIKNTPAYKVRTRHGFQVKTQMVKEENAATVMILMSAKR